MSKTVLVYPECVVLGYKNPMSVQFEEYHASLPFGPRMYFAPLGCARIHAQALAGGLPITTVVSYPSITGPTLRFPLTESSSTKEPVYNRFHAPEENDSEIARLRELHDAMDRAVLDAYGWTDLEPACDFFPEHEDDEGDSGRGRRRSRYRWPDHIRDEVLARLLDLNRQRSGQRAPAQESLF